jgi:hypothetical protein
MIQGIEVSADRFVAGCLGPSLVSQIAKARSKSDFAAARPPHTPGSPVRPNFTLILSKRLLLHEDFFVHWLQSVHWL